MRAEVKEILISHKLRRWSMIGAAPVYRPDMPADESTQGIFFGS